MGSCGCPCRTGGRQVTGVSEKPGKIKRGNYLLNFEKAVEENYVLEYTVISGGKEFTLWER